MIGWLILMLVTVVPVKIGAELFGAENKGFKFCILAVIVGTILSFASVSLIGGFLGLVIAYILVSLVYSKIFLFSFGGGLAFTLGVFVIQIGVAQALTDFGLLMMSSVA
ncbi:hypothetical protein [Motilimonas sp. E26]|uniref:hypothetical protein n=1 Tax=Motilimonas sp. E26 TaxID=2865674 RepID=UPI001E28F8A2|nr:hypothetical protein [Motilimonas sp. E26]MCE0558703.1 hypothetical protein [Motilimonas sp. E26]